MFGHLWLRPGLTRRERRLITVPCVGVGDAIGPIWSHVTSALGSGDITYERDGGAHPALPRLRRNTAGRGAPATWPRNGRLTNRDHATPRRRSIRERAAPRPRRRTAVRVHGIDGVSLRQIAAEAGSANNSAVHYHFGSKDGLIAAIFRHRLPQLISERRLLAARCDPDDLRSRFEAHYLPVLNLAEATGQPLRLVRRATPAPRDGARTSATLLPELPAEGQRSNEEFRHDLERLLGDLDEPLRQLRIAEAQALCLHAAADREQHVVADGAGDRPSSCSPAHLLDGLAGFLTAPASATTRRWLGRTGDVDDRRLRLL